MNTKFLLVVASSLLSVCSAAAADQSEADSELHNLVKVSAQAVVTNNGLFDQQQVHDSSSALSDLVQGINNVVSAAKSSVTKVDPSVVNKVLSPYVSSLASGISVLSQSVNSNDTLTSTLNVPVFNLYSLANAENVDGTEDLANAMKSIGADMTSFSSTPTLAARDTAQSDIYGYSEGTKMFAPIASATNQLLNANGTVSGLVYKDIDALDHVVDATTAALGTILGPYTGNVVTGVTNFLNGPIIQSINHGTYAVLARLAGDPVDAELQDIVPIAVTFSDTVAEFAQTVNNYDANTTQLDETNQLLRNRIQQINPSATFSNTIPTQSASALPTGIVGTPIAMSLASAIIADIATATNVAENSASPTTSSAGVPGGGAWWWPLRASNNKRKRDATAGQCASPDPTAVAAQLSRLVGAAGGYTHTVTVTVGAANGAAATAAAVDSGIDSSGSTAGINPQLLDLVRNIPSQYQDKIVALSDKFMTNGTINKSAVASYISQVPSLIKQYASQWAGSIPTDISAQISSAAANLPANVPTQLVAVLQNLPSDLPQRVSSAINVMPTAVPPVNTAHVNSLRSYLASGASAWSSHIQAATTDAPPSMPTGMPSEAPLSTSAFGQFQVPTQEVANGMISSEIAKVSTEPTVAVPAPSGEPLSTPALEQLQVPNQENVNGMALSGMAMVSTEPAVAVPSV